jgi:hypothetical protein
MYFVRYHDGIALVVVMHALWICITWPLSHTIYDSYL